MAAGDFHDRRLASGGGGAYSFSQAQDPPGSHHAKDPVSADYPARRPLSSIAVTALTMPEAPSSTLFQHTPKTDHDEAGILITCPLEVVAGRRNVGNDAPLLFRYPSRQPIVAFRESRGRAGDQENLGCVDSYRNEGLMFQCGVEPTSAPASRRCDQNRE